jgi:hypothetical protein
MKTELLKQSEISEADAGEESEQYLNKVQILSTRMLDVNPTRAGLHEKAEAITQPVYRISWTDGPARLFGLLPLPGTSRHSGKFIRVSPDRVKMPAEANHRFEMIEKEETAVFIDTGLRNSNISAILAVKNDGHWLELYRWQGSWQELGLSRLDFSNV